MPQTQAEQIWGLSKLASQDNVQLPASAEGRELLMLKMIQTALQRGVTWRTIGYVLVGSADAKAAKKVAKQLARDCQRHLLEKKAVEGELI